MNRNIIWDIDGTLFDTYPPIARAFKNAIEYLGKDVSLERIEALSKISLNHCVSTLSSECGLEEEDIEREFKRYYEKISTEESPPFSGVIEICDYICSIKMTERIWKRLKIGAACECIENNLASVKRGIARAANENVRLLLTQECALCGYPPVETSSLHAIHKPRQFEAC